jgi:hypothetical protein
LVNLVEEWEVLEEYSGDKQGYYQILGNDGSVEVRVHVGTLGFKKEFDNNADPLLSRILAFCKAQNYIRVSQAVRDELFFK